MQNTVNLFVLVNSIDLGWLGSVYRNPSHTCHDGEYQNQKSLLSHAQGTIERRQGLSTFLRFGPPSTSSTPLGMHRRSDPRKSGGTCTTTAAPIIRPGDHSRPQAHQPFSYQLERLLMRRTAGQVPQHWSCAHQHSRRHSQQLPPARPDLGLGHCRPLNASRRNACISTSTAEFKSNERDPIRSSRVGSSFLHRRLLDSAAATGRVSRFLDHGRPGLGGLAGQTDRRRQPVGAG